MATDWTAVTQVYNEAIDAKDGLVVEVYNPVTFKTLSVWVPRDRTKDFMSNLPLFEAEVK